MAEIQTLASALDALTGSNIDRDWEWAGGYPQRVVACGSVVLIADAFEDPDSPSRIAEYVAAADPPTVRHLFGLLEDAATVIERMANCATRSECSPELDRLVAAFRASNSQPRGDE